MKIIKKILKLLLCPVFLIVKIFYALASFLVGLTSAVFIIAALLLLILSVFLFITEGIKMGLLALAVAWAVSPFGLPLIAQFVLELLLSVKNSLKRLLT